ncbi:MAG TPA: BMP family ABC transporter substrate-binding protein [Candidatus Lachnoclostridium pullistercoris]|uniref:BMP family ABC transporter substrate-binding protein n=1 Tax=Candidatus Lachnoclostridium pullistercoris TaxID=2838632 RepID=A0A9D2PBB2_9FIRM|nr:BMP family ABC transporter substrate-binding protein [Candidatus Lachnoclostridium pullistercoris]
MKKKQFAALTMAVVMACSMAACGGAETEETAGNGSGANAEGEEPLKVGLVLSTGGLGDKNFNDMAYAGITRAQEDFGIEFDYVEPSTVSDLLPMDRQFAEAEEYDLIIAIASDQEEPIREIAEEFPDQKISLLDCAAEIDGVSTVQTEWSEQTFLAGVIAGMGTLSDMDKANSDNVIGVILGMDQPNLREGAAGFAAGARYVNPDVEVLEGVVGAFNDPGKGKEMALSMYNRGADFIQCIAGASGLGVFGGAKEADRYAFGVGTNQNSEDPDHVVASSVRSVDEMVYNEIQSVLDGTWEPGLKMSGMKEGAVDCDMEGSNVVLPDDIQKAVEDAREKIASGELVPCRSMDELDAWTAENQYTAE